MVIWCGPFRNLTQSDMKKQPWRALGGPEMGARMPSVHTTSRASQRVCRAVLAIAVMLFVAMPATRSLAASPPPEGVTAPEFSLQSLHGGALSLSQLRGHVVLVNFFATWCPPCRRETPSLNAAEKKYAARGVIFLGVDDEESAALVAQFARVKHVPYQIVLDTHGTVEKTYDVR